MDDTKKHDPLDQNFDLQDLEIEETEFVTDTNDVEAAESAAINSDTDIAQEATAHTAIVKEDELIEAISELEDAIEIAEEEEVLAEAEEGADRKHKGRESTSEKAKRSQRQSTSEKAKIAQEEKSRQLDPLRLRGKKYRAIAAMVDKTKIYSLEDAFELVKKTSITSFDAAIEMHCQVKTEGVRGTVTLPHGNGKSRKVAVATDDVIEQIAAGKLDFDVLLATPAQMPKLAKYAKLLGPKGLMPSPKAGTVTEDIEKTTTEINGGRVEYRADKTGVVHMSIGRVSFPVEQLVENFKAVEQILVSAKVRSVSLASTMGPGLKVAFSI